MSSFDDTNEMKSFVKKAMSIPLLEENHEKVLAKKWIKNKDEKALHELTQSCLLYTSPSPRDLSTSRMPSSA